MSFLCNRKFRWNPLLDKKNLPGRIQKGGKVDVTEATRRRRRILQAGFFVTAVISFSLRLQNTLLSAESLFRKEGTGQSGWELPSDR